MLKEKEQAVLLSQEKLAEGIFSIWIQTKAAKEAVPGQFMSVYTEDRSRLLHLLFYTSHSILPTGEPL